MDEIKPGERVILKKFYHNDIGEIRATVINFIIYFVFEDIIKVLDYESYDDAFADLAYGDYDLCYCMQNDGSKQIMIDHGALSMMLIKSEKKKAKIMKKWIYPELKNEAFIMFGYVPGAETEYEAFEKITDVKLKRGEYLESDLFRLVANQKRLTKELNKQNQYYELLTKIDHIDGAC